MREFVNRILIDGINASCEIIGDHFILCLHRNKSTYQANKKHNFYRPHRFYSPNSKLVSNRSLGSVQISIENSRFLMSPLGPPAKVFTACRQAQFNKSSVIIVSPPKHDLMTL